MEKIAEDIGEEIISRLKELISILEKNKEHEKECTTPPLN